MGKTPSKTSPSYILPVGSTATIEGKRVLWDGTDWVHIGTPIASHTRASLDAEIARLTALRDALPPEPKVETVRLYLGQYDGRWAGNNRQHGLDTHYLDVTIIDGVPQGWTKIEGGE